MTSVGLGGILKQLRAAVRPQENALADAELLDRFLQQRDESALESLLLRHGPMVLSVCRRILREEHDAEDAFQTTFLVLAHKAGQVSGRSAASWLYGVAQRTALEARRAAARRRSKESRAAPRQDHVRQDSNDLREVIDQALAHLPSKYREVILLCDLEERSRKEAAGLLGLPEGTISSRLARARSLLARLLARRGAGLSGGILAGLSQGMTAGEVPAALLSATIKAASLVVAGQAALGVISHEVATLTQGVIKAMWIAKMKNVLVVLLVAGMLGAASCWVYFQPAAAALPNADNSSSSQHDRPAKPTNEQVRKEFSLLKQQLQKAMDRAAALEASLVPPPEGSPEVLYQGKPARFWIKQLQDRDPAYRKPAVTALAGISEVDKTVLPILVRALADKDNQVSEIACAAIEQGDKEVVSDLIRALKGARAGHRIRVIRALGQIGPDAKAAVPALIGLLKDRTKLECYVAVEALEKIGPGAKAAVPALIKLLADNKGRWFTRNDGDIESLGVDLSYGQNYFVNPAARAAFALGNIGPDAKAALPALRKALKAAEGDPNTFEAVSQAIEKIAPTKPRIPS